MPDATFDDFLQTREEAAKAYVRGDGSKVDAMVPHEGRATFHGPGGDTVAGAQSVATRYLDDARAFRPNGTTHFDVIQKDQHGDLGFWTGFQVATAQIGDVPRPADMRMRVPSFFADTMESGS